MTYAYKWLGKTFRITRLISGLDLDEIHLLESKQPSHKIALHNVNTEYLINIHNYLNCI